MLVPGQQAELSTPLRDLTAGPEKQPKVRRKQTDTRWHFPPKTLQQTDTSLQFPASESKKQRLRKHTAAAQERSHGIIAHNANLLWQHEAAAADQGSAGGPLTTPLGPLGRLQFGQPEQHLLSRAACLCRLSQRCCCASEWMSNNGQRCNVRFKSATRSGVPVMQTGCLSVLGSSDKSTMSFSSIFHQHRLLPHPPNAEKSGSRHAAFT